MSMTKRWMEEEAAAMRADKKSNCECYYIWDDKFEVLCDEHRDEIEHTDEAVYTDENNSCFIDETMF